ncbi:PAQR family membrane homeostasis protein TrhA [Cupriavidus basilensis]|uniref:PAQR family membrane homeostasis protein TrhA n=1 Tax=Cupriavidus basilensis TaxID=68895 RepID=UPI0020A670C6|nr:hemolysin III family protein [Cupriavidus basilensis]MCP3020642.1 hemolysin III family protein [Cupriavidus basilensis]MDR3382211.1 hemolysin III family protein [Cupriavidus basilensis]
MYRGERFNGYSHLAGAVLAAAGTAVLITSSALYHDAWKVVSSIVYGATLVFLYTISTLYHSLRGRPKDILRRLDYCAIYLLIAGSYTPFALVTLRGPWGWTLFGVNWGLAVIGIAQELLIGHRTRVFSLLIYVLMGWLVLFAFGPLVAALPAAGLYWLVAGGALYTAGIGFFLFDEKVRHFHGIWHLFVLAGSACQFVSILWYVG